MIPLDVFEKFDANIIKEALKHFKFEGHEKMAEACDLIDEPDDSFALMVIRPGQEVQRSFPVMDRLHSIMSGMSLLNNQDMLEPEITRKVKIKIISKLPDDDDAQTMCDLLGLDEAGEDTEGPLTCSADELFSPDVSPADIDLSPEPESFLFDMEVNGKKVKSIPIDTAEQRAEAYKFLLENQDDIAPELFADAMNKLKGFMGEEPQAKIASIKIGDKIETEMFKRLNMVGKKNIQKYATAWNMYNRESVNIPGMIEKIASVDRELGIDRFWGKDLETPQETVMGIDKSAFKYVYQSKQNPEIKLTEDQILRISQNDSSKLKAHFGDEFIKEFSADPISFFQHLPDVHKDMIGRLANGY